MKETKNQSSYEEVALGNLRFLQAASLVVAGMSLICTILFLFQYKDTYTREYADSSLSMAGGCIIFGLVFTCFSLLIPSLRMVVKAAHHYVKGQEEK